MIASGNGNPWAVPTFYGISILQRILLLPQFLFPFRPSPVQTKLEAGKNVQDLAPIHGGVNQENRP